MCKSLFNQSKQLRDRNNKETFKELFVATVRTTVTAAQQFTVLLHVAFGGSCCTKHVVQSMHCIWALAETKNGAYSHHIQDMNGIS